MTRDVGHLLAFANSVVRKIAHSRGPSKLKNISDKTQGSARQNELGLSLGKHGQHGEKESRFNRQRRLDERAGGAPRETDAVPRHAAPREDGFLLYPGVRAEGRVVLRVHVLQRPRARDPRGDRNPDPRADPGARLCVEINQCVGCTKSLLGDGAAVLAPRHRAGVASMAWRTTR